MGVPVPWTKHAQIEWESRAADTDLPLWLRVACLAYGRHDANGHANFGRGEMSMILGVAQTDAAAFKPQHRSTVYNAIQTAVRRGWIAKGSGSECLVVPNHAIEGPQGNPLRPCIVCARKAGRPARPPRIPRRQL